MPGSIMLLFLWPEIGAQRPMGGSAEEPGFVTELIGTSIKRAWSHDDAAWGG
jgi:hypothetical protein